MLNATGTLYVWSAPSMFASIYVTLGFGNLRIVFWVTPEHGETVQKGAKKIL